MKILVTGNSGYIGNHLVDLLKKQNHEVYGQDLVDPVIDVDYFLKEDIRTGTWTEHNFDCVIHLAALVKVGESEDNPIEYYSTNIDGTVKLLSKVSTKNFIFASTGVAEKCINPYGISKRAAEDCVKQYCNSLGIPYTIFRFYNVIGSTVAPATNPDGLFFNLVKAQLTGKFNLYGTDYDTIDGSAIRDYVHVEEICHAILQAVSQPSNSIENLGHGQGYSVRQIIDLFKIVNGIDFEIVDTQRRKGDLEVSVLDHPSTYMPKLNTIEDMLRIK